MMDEPVSLHYVQVGEGPRKTKYRNVIFVAISVIAVVAIALAAPLGVILNRSSSNSGSQSTNAGSLCLTRECIKLAASVLSTIDETADPCTDFYQFSCGNWLQNAVIPPGEFCDVHGRDICRVLLHSRMHACTLRLLATIHPTGYTHQYAACKYSAATR